MSDRARRCGRRRVARIHVANNHTDTDHDDLRLPDNPATAR